MAQNNSNNRLTTAILFAVFWAVVVGVFILISGKMDSFQIVNGNHSVFFDFFFRYFTFLGDGAMWIPLLFFCIIYKKKYVNAILVGFLISTMLTHFFKRIVFADELRPIAFLTNEFPIHLVKDVTMRRLHSFPSGHTATAFTISIIVAMFIKSRVAILFIVFAALLVGYSRVYLAQHFVIDVWGGICIGIVSAFVSKIFSQSKQVAE